MLASAWSRRAGSLVSAAAWAAERKRLTGERRSCASVSVTHPHLLHQLGDAIEHLVDLQAEPVERIVGARQRYPPGEVAAGDPAGDRDDVADPLADILGKDESADEAEQERERRSRSAASVRACCEARAPAAMPSADQPFARRQAVDRRAPPPAGSVDPRTSAGRFDSLPEAAAPNAGDLRDCRRSGGRRGRTGRPRSASSP